MTGSGDERPADPAGPIRAVTAVAAREAAATSEAAVAGLPVLRRKPHAEVVVDATIVARLLAAQHPDLAELPLSLLGSGWDNVLFRLGDDLLVRVPRRYAAAALVEHEQRWLPELAPRLPVPVPVPVRVGRPGEGFPWHWTVARWLPGEPLASATITHPTALAEDLAAFLVALHQPAPPDAPLNPYRGVPLPARHERTMAGIEALRPADGVEPAAVARCWERLAATPPWDGPPQWLHGDLHPANVLVAGGRLTAVIDFGDLTAGDPACDLAVAWMVFPPGTRAAMRRAYPGLDDDTWTRARAWALALGVAYLQGADDDPVLHRLGRNTLRAVLDNADGS